MADQPDKKEDGFLRVNDALRIPLDEIEMRASRSSGPGGQHANKTETRIEALFDVDASNALSSGQRRRLERKIGPVVRAVAQDERSQSRNRELALARLAERIADALVVDKHRVATAPTKTATEKRLSKKRARATVKNARQKPDVNTEE
ncbi:MAG TPA: alternative ribosome rescue aminoacyl-tRNA hydrolase ArfB [Solirubrobacterales bacterium]|jgi:ribosome-associated protein|nr:alternative ribosome rescue aminoacyl-tRNA hydrolase ArfB [Solirubrobacterales bacterium]